MLQQRLTGKSLVIEFRIHHERAPSQSHVFSRYELKVLESTANFDPTVTPLYGIYIGMVIAY